MDFVWMVRYTGTSTADVDQYVYLNNGAGSFSISATLQVAYQGIPAAAIGDINNDGKLDIIFVHYSIAAQPRLFLGNGDGTFGTHTILPAQDDGKGIGIDYNVTEHLLVSCYL